jgi:uncharacterized protein YxjI
MNPILHRSVLILRQRRELAELVGFETRNKYEILDEAGQALGFCAEQQKGFLGFLLRYLLGHWRSFSLSFFDANRQPLWRAEHPFRWFFQRLEVFGAAGEKVGAVQQRFGIFRKVFDLEDATGRVLFRMESGFFQFWTFPIQRSGREVARVEKKWSGLLKEMFLDADNFRIQFGAELSESERLLVLAAGIFVDLQYFERKSS